MGFDIDCVIDIHTYPGGFFCPVCRTLVYPQEALQSQCKHLYCRPCLAHIDNGSRVCPYDGYLVTESDCKPLMVSDIELAKRIDNVKVHCLYFRSGCKWKGSLSECTSHCLGCLFGNSQVLCVRCGLKIIHRHGQDHAQSCSGAKRAQYAGCDANQQSNQPFYHVQQHPVPLQAQQQSHVYTEMPQQFRPPAASTLSTAYLSTQLPPEPHQPLQPHPITQTEHLQQLQSHVLEHASPQRPVQLQLLPQAQSLVQVPPQGQTNICAPEQVFHQQEPQVSQDQLPWWNVPSPPHSQVNQPVPYAQEMSMQHAAQNSQIPQYQQPHILMPNPQASQAQLHCQSHSRPQAYSEILNQLNSQIEEQFHHVQPPTDPFFFPVVQPIEQSHKYDKLNIKPSAPQILDEENHGISSHKFGGPEGYPGGYDVNVRFPPIPDHLKRGATICDPWTPSFGEHMAPDPLHKRISSDEVFGKDEHDGHLMFKELSCPNNSNMFEVAGHDATPINSHVGVLGVSRNFHPHPPFDQSVGGEVSNVQLFEDSVMRNNYFTLPSKRMPVSTGWCPIDCQTTEGLDIHSQSREHQIRAMDLAEDIMQQSKKKQRTFAGPASHNEGSNRTMEAGNNP